MTRLAVTFALALMLGSAANACSFCENEDELAAIYAYMDFSGMTEDEIATRKLAVLETFHKKQMELARANFVSRFHLVSRDLPTAAPVVLASSAPASAATAR